MKRIIREHEIEEPAPMMIKNPNTGAYINIAGLFQHAQLYECAGKPYDLTAAVDHMIRMVSLNVVPSDIDILDLNNLFFGMYVIRDIFESMKE